MKIILYFSFIICLFAYNSCDILRLSAFEVISCSPEDGYHSSPEDIIVSLTFSHEPNRSSVERNFSLNADTHSIRGVFFWEEKTLTFMPLTPLEKNTDYTINLSANAHNTDGLSMDDAFSRNFTTRSDNTRPILISYSPSMYEQVDDLRKEIVFKFSIPVPIETLYSNISFSPSAAGIWRLEENDTLAVFTPAEPWFKNSRYEIRFSDSLADINGNTIENSFLSIFTTQTDNEEPYLLSANQIKKNGDIFLLSLETENNDWEKDDKILLIFSEPVDSLTLRNYIEAADGPSVLMETSSGYQNEFTFRFETIPVYESRFTLKIKPGIKDAGGKTSKNEYIYRVFANGRFSMPPVLAGMRIPMSPRNEAKPDLRYFGINQPFEIIPISEENYPSSSSVFTFIELYFSTAEGAAIDLFSVMELFRIETSNNVISFSPRLVKNANFSINEPHAGMENFQRIEISGYLENSLNAGIINFLIAAGLRDSLGNQNDKPLRISLTK